MSKVIENTGKFNKINKKIKTKQNKCEENRIKGLVTKIASWKRRKEIFKENFSLFSVFTFLLTTHMYLKIKSLPRKLFLSLKFY